jgi:hypothetical protein
MKQWKKSGAWDVMVQGGGVFGGGDAFLGILTINNLLLSFL